ncbi:MAG: hypothetical protein IT267_01055 [Saprospiraceae bacterium]|nr:hypothetical protein [Saprospiraceae bacterium]
MTHNLFCYFILLAFACNKNFDDKVINLPIEICIDTTLIPSMNIDKSPDLFQYLIRRDSPISTAIKLVPTQGYINWMANASVEKFGNRYGLALINYGDTPNIQMLPKYAFNREVVSFEIILDTLRHLLYGDNELKVNPKALVAGYVKSQDDGDVFDALWDEDSIKTSSYKINHIDPVKCIIEGEYDLYFYLKEPSVIPNRKYAPKAQFTCGKFKVSVP